MKKKILWVLFLSLIVHASGFAQSDSDDEDECDQCQVCFGTQDLRQVCECLKHICLTCLEGWEKSKAGHETSISCPNCRRPWLRTDVIAILAPRAAMRRLIAEETSARNQLEFLERMEHPNPSTNLSPAHHPTWRCDWFPLCYPREGILSATAAASVASSETAVERTRADASMYWPRHHIDWSWERGSRIQEQRTAEGERMPSSTAAERALLTAAISWPGHIDFSPERNFQTMNEQNNTRPIQNNAGLDLEVILGVYLGSI